MFVYLCGVFLCVYMCVCVCVCVCVFVIHSASTALYSGRGSSEPSQSGEYGIFEPLLFSFLSVCHTVRMARVYTAPKVDEGCHCLHNLGI